MRGGCAKIDELVDRGDPEAMAELEQHAAECSTCAAELREWEEISAAARGLHVEWESPALLARIERAMEEEAAPSGAVVRFGRRPTLLLQIAATILLVVGLTALTARMIAPTVSVSPATTDRAAYDDWVVRESAIDGVERAEKIHLASIDRLSKLAAPAIENDHSPLMVSYREKLMLLDDAIAECQAQIKENRYNAHLRRQLLAVYQEKDRTLRDILEDENHAR